MKCSHCGKSALHPCKQGCGIAYYCNRNCSKAHYKSHKKECQKAANLRSSSGGGYATAAAAPASSSVAYGGNSNELPGCEDLTRQEQRHIEEFIWGDQQKRMMTKPDIRLRTAWSIMFPLYNQKAVFHHDPRGCKTPQRILEHFVGVYTPESFPINFNSPFPFFVSNPHLTNMLVEDFHECNDMGNARELIEHGMVVKRSSPYGRSVASLVQLTPEYHLQVIIRKNDGVPAIAAAAAAATYTITRSDTKPPGFVSAYSDAKRKGQINKRAILGLMESAFDEWTFVENNSNGTTTTHTVRMAFTPFEIFERAFQFVSPEMPLLSKLGHPFCDDLPSLVLHTLPPGHAQAPGALEFLDKTVLGVYVPSSDRFHGIDDGRSRQVWCRDPNRTLSLLRSMKRNSKVEKCLESHCISLRGDKTAIDHLCLYFDRDTGGFVVTAFSGGIIRDRYEPIWVMRESPLPDIVLGLLDREDDLFRYREQMFTAWEAFVYGSSFEYPMAMTPLPRFERAIELAELEVQMVGNKKEEQKIPSADDKDDATRDRPVRTRNKKKKRKNSKRGGTGDKNADLMESEAPVERTTPSVLATPSEGSDRRSKKPPVERDDRIGVKDPQENLTPRSEDALTTPRITTACEWLLQELTSSDGKASPPEWKYFTGAKQGQTIDALVQRLFDTKEPDKPLWIRVEESLTSPILEDILTQSVDDSDCESTLEARTRDWIRDNAFSILEASSSGGRFKEMITLVRSNSIIPSVPANMACQIFGRLPPTRGENELANKLAQTISVIRLDSPNDVQVVMKCASDRISKKAKTALRNALRKGETELRKRKKPVKISDNERRSEKQEPKTSLSSSGAGELAEPGLKQNDNDNVSAKNTGEDIDRFCERIEESMQWYSDLLNSFGVDRGAATHEKLDRLFNNRNDEGASSEDSTKQKASSSKKLSSDEISRLIQAANQMPQDKADEVIHEVETSLDISNWDTTSEWVVEITEQAHKWFRKASKKKHLLCERVARRLQLLSIGRWPYVLCKRVVCTSGKASSIQLYESKIDSGSRILWEVAISFSPRRSSEGKYFSEQVIRVWDIVEDHDNLTRSINRAVERIEKSHRRGKECMIYSQLDGYNATDVREITRDTHGLKLHLPRVFSMQQGVQGEAESPQGAHFSPANDDEKQFNLLKFYELNAGAVSLLLDASNDELDLPFTPGPLEHEIIHYHSDPPRSILLMGRSGTGKTTCLVFRMWARYMAYVEDEGVQPRQLFVTKNDILRSEVKRSFDNMGLAWRQRLSSDGNVDPARGAAKGGSTDNSPDEIEFPLFLTSSEWVDLLDRELPGDRFFNLTEMEQRTDSRREDDAVQRGMEAFFADDGASKDEQTAATRREMTFQVFRKLWRKINSRVKTAIDPALVWLEIKSHIKGSVASLRIGDEDRSTPRRRFLSLTEYLGLPRKQSRIDEGQRRTVFELYQSYERLKKEGNYYDEMDVVYYLAGRIPNIDEVSRGLRGLLPVDAVFVDEVQDFTQSELFLLTKLCSDPNNLMLCGDTAQSIAVGVSFRFTDVRQIFFDSFGGIKPNLLQLTHNYRSHSGILKLAGSVVELLYFFFSDSLDRLPPDFGLFSGPKPIIMEVPSMADLVLMLDGSKRDTSRIEFGAHQVVIVRNEEAKKSLPEEFGVDKDWVMTVQQSKGLEFDDVLLYNFFTDSPAEQLWRVVSNYTLNDAKDFHNQCQIMSSTSVRTVEWDAEVGNSTRHLSFERDKHKILESEFKMLYTALTRARVNVYIAESDLSTCQPMFNYFKQRRLVDCVENNDEGLPGIRAFGNLNTKDEWRSRGEYYLEKANDNTGCLRLAAKCFEKAGEDKKRDYALAYLAFVEMEENEDADKGKRRARQAMERSTQLYDIASKLLEARDIEFLSKAGLCLMRIGPTEYARSARIFEVYACIHYAKRRGKECDGEGMVSHHERQHFSYAAGLFSRCIRAVDVSYTDSNGFIVDAFRCFICADELIQASLLLKNNSEHCLKVFSRLVSIWRGGTTSSSPLNYWNVRRMQQGSKDAEAVNDAMSKLARIACRSCYTNKDAVGLSEAVNILPSRGDRIQVLSSLENSADRHLQETIWGRFHPSFADAMHSKNTSKTKTMPLDVTKMLVRQYLDDGNRGRAADILEERGRLLEAVDCLQEAASDVDKKRVFELQCRYVELVLGCLKWKQLEQKESLSSLFDTLRGDEGEMKDQVSLDVRLSYLISQARFTGTEKHLLEAFDVCTKTEQAWWKYRGAELVIEKRGIEFLLERAASGIWKQHGFLVSIGRNLSELTKSISRQHSENIATVSQLESCFDLAKNSDPTLLSTQVVTNGYLRTALQDTNEQLPNASSFMSSSSLTVMVKRESMHSILSQYVCLVGYRLITKLEQFLVDNHEAFGSAKDPIRSVVGRANYLQSCISCMEELKRFSLLGRRTNPEKASPWDSRFKEAKKKQKDFTKKLLEVIHTSSYIGIQLVDEEGAEAEPHVITIRKQITPFLLDVADEHWRLLSRRQKQTDLAETIKFWQISHLCNDRAAAPIDALGSMMQREESHARNNFNEKKLNHLIRSSIVAVDHKVQSVKLLFRFWIWAVESAREHLFNSINLVERLMEKTSSKPGLVPLRKQDQISLLEVNTVGLFSLLSFRYSEASTKEFWVAFPERSYVKCHLIGHGYDGNTPGRGFGTCVKEALGICEDNKNYFHFFEKFVCHLETLAGQIIEGKLLSIDCLTGPKQKDSRPEEVRCFERAAIISLCILCNAVSLIKVGKVLSKKQALDQPNTLPRLPLGGKLRCLFIELRESLVRLQGASSSWRKEIGGSTGHNLLQVTSAILKKSLSDRLVFCRIHRDYSRNLIEVDVRDEMNVFSSAVGDLSFRGVEGLFNNDPVQCQEFLTGTHLPQSAEDINAESEDMKDFSRISDERNALSVIDRYVRAWRQRKTSSYKSSPSYFRKWKATMTQLARLVSDKIDKKKRSEVKMDVPLGVEVDGKVSVEGKVCYPLSSISYFWKDPAYLNQGICKWKQSLPTHYPVFSDAAECQFCGMYWDSTIYQDRRFWCQSKLPYLPYGAAAVEYNRCFYQCEYLQSDTFQSHCNSYEHQNCVQYYSALVNTISELLAYFEISMEILMRVISICQHEVSQGGSHTSWYLILEEEASSLYQDIKYNYDSTIQMFSMQQFADVGGMIQNLQNKSLVAQNFLTAKLNEEKMIIDKQAATELEEKEPTEEETHDDFVLPTLRSRGIPG